VGVVADAGAEVEGFEVGDWVFHGRYVGHRGWSLQDVSTASGESNDSHLTIQLPEGNRHLFALLGVAGVGTRAVRRTRVEGPQNVWVAGAGPIGLFAAQAAQAFGANVTVTDLIPRRLDVARELGMGRVIDAGTGGYEEALKEEGPYDRVIDACGAETLIHDIAKLGLLAHGGVIGLIAVRSETRFGWGMLHATEGSIEVSCHFGLGELKLLVDLIGRGVIRVDPLITHKEPIEDAPGVYELLRDSPSEPLGIVFDWA
jgi:L-iditol 2-dehydrogenase